MTTSVNIQIDCGNLPWRNPVDIPARKQGFLDIDTTNASMEACLQKILQARPLSSANDAGQAPD
jgi:hypothetical protein